MRMCWSQIQKEKEDYIYMNKISKLQKKLKNGECVILDSAMGSEIQSRGIHTTLPLWSADALFENADIVQKIHEDNIKAGAEIIITDTFRTTKRAFLKKGIEEQASAMAKKAVAAARNAITAVKPKHEVYIAASVAPLEECYSPELTPPTAEMNKEHMEIVRDLKDGGADFILFETMITLGETISGLQAAQKLGIPAAVCFCLNDNLALLSGEKLEDVLPIIEKYNPIYVGVNCVDAHIATKAIRLFKSLTTLPVCVYAQGDGGVDKFEGWKNTEESKLDYYIQEAKHWAADGAQIIGGCCGTSPTYVVALKQL